MNPGGVLLVVVGVWVVSQVLAGDALGRLNLTGSAPAATSTERTSPSSATAGTSGAASSTTSPRTVSA
ncbi:MAG TPA: hypothetical protein VGC04_11275 [Cellulomonas sp.]